MDKIFRRRQYFIDKRFQAKFIFKFCIIIIVSSLLIAGVLLFLSRNSTTVTIENARVQVKATADFILPLIIETLLIVLIFSASAVLLLTLFYSHKISGPLYRLKKEIEALTTGDFNRDFHIRGNDQLQEISSVLTKMCGSLKERIIKIKEVYKTLDDYLRSKDSFLSEEDKKEFKVKLERFKKELDNFKAL